MKQYMKFYGPINGLVCVGLGLLFFTFNVVLIEFEDSSMRLFMYTPVPLILTGMSLMLFPGIKLTRQEVRDQNISFWSASPKMHRLIWVLFGILGAAFLVFQLLNALGVAEFPFDNCLLSKYFGIGSC